ncbi:TKL/TKL-ccin protein kinase [Mycena venus]|uniref:TKL/TKL-ccin protein kinase n=1 Tax=Mycena venus TaxID=2733690 RepID=A0A8H6YS97_9AGAR|nr:TKL/TKL-ccin protein kinase [Mycena venus]
MDDSFQFIKPRPHVQGYKERPRLVTSCDNCRLKKIKCLQPTPETKCEACKAARLPCRFRDRERYFAERSRAIAGPNVGSPYGDEPRSSSGHSRRSSMSGSGISDASSDQSFDSSFSSHSQQRRSGWTFRSGSGISDASSDQSFESSFSPQSGWNSISYDVSAHQLALKELDLTSRVTKLDAYPFESGGVADIYRGLLKASNLPVAVKIFRRMHAEPETLEKICKSLYEEARIWRRLEHPNILPLLGISLDLGLSPALVSPLCAGPIMKYAQHNSKDSRQRLEMVIGVATGLCYLHSEGIVHGNLCTKKVLVYDDGTPVICGYGMSKTVGQTAHTTSLFSSPIRFAAPECFSVGAGTPAVPMTSRDVYSFSMLALEILSGLQPFHHLPTEHAVFIYVLRGERPIRTHLEPGTVTNRMWRLLNSLWDQNPLLRPEMPDVVASLFQVRDDFGVDEDDIELDQSESAARRNEKDERASSGEETSFEV